MKIVIIDDQEDIRYTLKKILAREGYESLAFAGDEEDIVASVKSFRPSLIVIDIMLENGLSGIDLAKRFKEANINVAIIMITAYTSSLNIIEATRNGVKDILQKPFESSEFLEFVRQYANKKRKKSNEVIFLEENKESFIGSFETMKSVYKKIGIAASNDASVLIRGETGTGKELIAKMIHQSSERSHQPLVSVNCAAIPSELFESQMFGHEKGSFTGADKQHIGFIEQAIGGTLFLDEVGELEFTLQSKLLRFLETMSFRRVGGLQEFGFEGRIISATHIDFAKHIATGLFREDLYYRLSMLTIELPPLSQRTKDIPALCNHFISKGNKEFKTQIQGISKTALDILCTHSWRGNVRELRNVIYNALLEANGTVITQKDIQLVKDVHNTKGAIGDAIASLIDQEGLERGDYAYELLEKEFLKIFLQKASNISQASRYLNLSRNTLKAKLKKYELYES